MSASQGPQSSYSVEKVLQQHRGAATGLSMCGWDMEFSRHTAERLDVPLLASGMRTKPKPARPIVH